MNCLEHSIRISLIIVSKWKNQKLFTHDCSLLVIAVNTFFQKTYGNPKHVKNVRNFKKIFKKVFCIRILIFLSEIRFSEANLQKYDVFSCVKKIQILLSASMPKYPSNFLANLEHGDF